MRVSVGYHVIFRHMKADFRLSFIGFHNKVSMTKINIGSKDVEFNIDEGFSWVSEKSMTNKNEHKLEKVKYNTVGSFSKGILGFICYAISKLGVQQG